MMAQCVPALVAKLAGPERGACARVLPALAQLDATVLARHAADVVAKLGVREADLGALARRDPGALVDAVCALPTAALTAHAASLICQHLRSARGCEARADAMQVLRTLYRESPVPCLERFLQGKRIIAFQRKAASFTRTRLEWALEDWLCISQRTKKELARAMRALGVHLGTGAYFGSAAVLANKIRTGELRAVRFAALKKHALLKRCLVSR